MKKSKPSQVKWKFYLHLSPNTGFFVSAERCLRNQCVVLVDPENGMKRNKIQDKRKVYLTQEFSMGLEFSPTHQTLPASTALANSKAVSIFFVKTPAASP